MKLQSLTLVSLSLLVFACTAENSPKSYNTAEIDEANNLITRYGLSEMPKYDELLNFKTVEVKDAEGKIVHPWTDTYWPTTHKNLAARWSYINAEDEANQDPTGDFQIGAYFKTQIEATATGEDALSINLSPAEKFDIAYRSIKNLTLDEHGTSFKALLSLDERHADFLKPEVAQTDRLGKKRGLAREYFYALDADQALSELSPLATEGYKNWISNSLNESYAFPGETVEGAMDWSWEGICHGWAPAAVMADEPKHAVKVKVKTAPDTTKELLFTEGDIRALLSKTWAEASNDEQFFIGRRCEANVNDPKLGVPSNAEGRGVTGSMSYTNEAGEASEGQFTIVQEYPRKSGRTALYRVILENEWKDGAPKYAYLIEHNEGWRRLTSLSFDEKEAFAQIESQTRLPSMKNVSKLEYFGCWDVNPASFHSILVDNLGKKNLGFVMDRTQSGQVWNQPIGKAEFEIGELKAVGDVAEADKAKHYRAPGTAFIAQVKAVVHWSSEPHLPRFSYTRADGSDFDAEMIKKTTYDYTLEFDADKRLIGGEWGTLDSFKTHENPDFLFGFTSKVEPNLGAAKEFLRDGYTSIIKKIHECSLKGEVKGTMTADQDTWGSMETHTISFVDCEI